MASSKFCVDLARGKRGEERFVELIHDLDAGRGLPPFQVTKTDTAGHDYSIQCAGMEWFAELKCDYKFSKTGNLAVEIRNPRRGTDSGLTSTKADVWGYVLGEELWVATTVELRAVVESGKYRVVERAGDGNATVVLVPGADVLGPVFTRLDHLTPRFRRSRLLDILERCPRFGEWVNEQYKAGRSTQGISKSLSRPPLVVREAMKRTGLPFPGENRDLAGQQFNCLTVIKMGRDSLNRHVCDCLCVCGRTRTVGMNSLKVGDIRSCGRCEAASRFAAGKKWKGVGELSGTQWGSIRNGALARGIPLNLTIEEAWELFEQQGGHCALTGVPITFKTFGPDKLPLTTASLDRIDSSRDYSLQNCQWLHKDVNLIKMDFSEDEFIRWCLAVAVHSGLAIPLDATSQKV